MTATLPEFDAGMQRAVAAAQSTPSASPAVTFVADLVCPWCYIAFARLQRVMAGSPASLRWHPFLLNPYLPAEGVMRRHYLERKFGSVAQANAVHRRAIEVGGKEGIAFAFPAIKTQPNTILAHALVLAAARQERAMATVAALFRGFFVEGRDIGQAEALADLAAEIGLVPQAGEPLTAGSDLERVVAAHQQAQALSITGVPVCRFGDDHLIAGAQPDEVLTALLDLEIYRSAVRRGGPPPTGATPRSHP